MNPIASKPTGKLGLFALTAVLCTGAVAGLSSRARADKPDITIDSLGAVADGKTDCRAAIQKAFDQVKQAGGGTIRFTSGSTYSISDTIGSSDMKDRYDNVDIEGSGATLLCTMNRQPRPAIRLMGSHVVINGLTIDFSEPTDTVKDSYVIGGDAIYVGGTAQKEEQDIQITKCQIKHAWFAGVRPVFASKVVVADCTISNCLATSIFPGSLRKDVKILRNTITNTKDDGIFVGTGKYAWPTDGVVIQGNKVRTSSAKGIGVGGARNVLIANNTVVDTSGPGIDCEVTDQTPFKMSVIRITGNTVQNAGRNFGPKKYHTQAGLIGIGIFLPGTVSDDYQDVEISSNVIQGSNGDGISVVHGEQVRILNNTVSDCGGMGVVIGLPRGTNQVLHDFVVSGNNISNTGHHGLFVVNAGRGIVAGNSVTSYGVPGQRSDRGLFVYQADGVVTASNNFTNDRGAGDATFSASSTRVGAVDTGLSLSWSPTVPTTGIWSPGDVVFNSAPKPGSPLGWRCTAPGSPGTWQELPMPGS